MCYSPLLLLRVVTAFCDGGGGSKEDGDKVKEDGGDDCCGFCCDGVVTRARTRFHYIGNNHVSKLPPRVADCT